MSDQRSTYRMRRDDEGTLHRVVVLGGMDGFVVRWTDSCSGCFEAGDYGGNAHNYPYDEKARCHIGAGCNECGYTGKTICEEWVPFDMKAYCVREARRERRRVLRVRAALAAQRDARAVAFHVGAVQ
jgi:hypothetical protein